MTNPDENTDENTDDERFTLSDTVFVGRRADAYEALFDLDLAELDADSLLDCPGGPCSFTAHANERGLDATAVDALYGRPPAEIRDRAEAGVDTLRATFAGDGDASRFCWSFYDSVDAMLRRFTEASERFLDDYRDHWQGDRYRQAELPTLPFDDDTFDLVVSGHLLFVYGETFSYGFHERSLLELCRVSADQVRVAPITEQEHARRYRHLPRLRETVEDAGYTTRIRPGRLPFFDDDPEILVVDC